MNILCLTDQFDGADHSAIEGVFGKYLAERAEVQLGFFDRSADRAAIRGKRIVLPYACKHRKMLRTLESGLDLKRLDLVVVRNFLPVLGQMLKGRDRYGYRLGFWHSFPHDFRRVHEARLEKKAVSRKTLEYAWKRFREERRIGRADFLITMSVAFRETFHPRLQKPCFILPMGVDFKGLPSSAPRPIPPTAGPKKFIYSGAVDGLRQSADLARAFHETPGDFILDFYTASRNPTVRQIAELPDPRIRLLPAVPRAELFRLMGGYDVGLGLLPNNELYRVSSPTKTFEYYALGLPALINPLPEYREVFDDQMAFYCDFTGEAIRRRIAELLAMPREMLAQRGARGRAAVLAKRNYQKLAEGLFDFLRARLPASRTPTQAEERS
ncbi:MAG: glycosyltransferase [Deltaproteobacteria bacterium]|nr:glycosyltransferase [Deltaproteobacteria bacterium]